MTHVIQYVGVPAWGRTRRLAEPVVVDISVWTMRTYTRLEIPIH